MEGECKRVGDSFRSRFTETRNKLDCKLTHAKVPNCWCSVGESPSSTSPLIAVGNAVFCSYVVFFYVFFYVVMLYSFIMFSLPWGTGGQKSFFLCSLIKGNPKSPT